MEDEAPTDDEIKAVAAWFNQNTRTANKGAYEIVGVSAQAVRTWMDRGLLRYVTIHGVHHIWVEDLEAMRKQREGRK